MKLVAPRSAFATMSELTLALSQLEQQSQQLIEENFHKQLIEGEAALRSALSTLDQAKLAKQNAANARQTQGTLLIRSVRDFHQNLLRTIRREPDMAVWLENFRLKQGMPRTSTINATWLEQARQIAATGEALAAKQAANPQSLQVLLPNSPSVDQVAATLKVAQVAHEAYRLACSTLKAAEEAARQMNAQNQNLLTGLRKRLSGVFQGLSPERRRVEMLKFGVRYVNKTQEPTDSEPSGPLNQTTESERLSA